MTHLVWFKFLLLLTFAVWMHQCEAFDSKLTALNDCCNFGRNRSKMSCDGSSLNFSFVPGNLMIECRSQYKYCCRKQRETDECEEGILAAQNGSSFLSSTIKFTICNKACSLGIKMAEKGDDCNRQVKGEELLEINARKKCCESKREEIILSDDEETNEAIGEDDDYVDEENDALSEESDFGGEETEPPETTGTEITTTSKTIKDKAIDYDETTTSAMTRNATTDSLHEDTTVKFLETKEVDTVTTTRRSPPIYRHSTSTHSNLFSSGEEKPTIMSLKKPLSEVRHFYYEHPQHPGKSTNPPKTSIHIRYCDYVIMDGARKCICKSGYVLQHDGKTCLKADGSRLAPEEIKRKMCHHGFFMNDFGDCQDINECKIQNNGCGDRAYCKNEIGYYECIPRDICKSGFKYDEHLKTCEDIDECAEYPKTCEDGKICKNTVGSYSCESIYELTRCEATTYPTPQENCPRGFERNNRGVCVDIDECISNPCNEGRVCVNRNGDYICEPSHCGRGLRLEGRNCVDIDECENNPCPLTHNCLNIFRSYTCKMKTCHRGFRLDANGKCEDINECLIYKNICRNADCINTNGSFTCNCKAGYRKDMNNYCSDIDECADHSHGCSHHCSNTFGGYKCSCRKGYRLNSDKRTCVDIDECRDNGDVLCQGDCVNTEGSYECRCPAGFRQEESYCSDIDECQDPNICDRKESHCLNVPGSFECIDIRCKDGYKLIRRKGERYCRLRTICETGDYEDEEEICNEPWIYSYHFSARSANFSASNIFHLMMNSHQEYDVDLLHVRAGSTKETVKTAGFDDFKIRKFPSEFYLTTTQPIDGPQAVDIEVLVTFKRPDGRIEYKRGIMVKIIVSELSFYKFSVRK